MTRRRSLAPALDAQTGATEPGVAVIVLPEPPTINVMLGWARKKTHRGPTGNYMRQAQSVYWVEQRKYYDAVKRVMLDASVAAFGARYLPLPRWRIVSAHFRLHQLRDDVELMSGLKWPVDALKAHGIVEDDSPRHLMPFAECPPVVTQEVARADRGVTLTIADAVRDWLASRVGSTGPFATEEGR
jgi:hypothetical protein